MDFLNYTELILAGVQGIGIIALVGITLYYACQTRELVKEGRQKRNFEFLERRLLHFYNPLILLLNNMMKNIKDSKNRDVFIISRNHNELDKLHKETFKELIRYGFMIPPKTYTLILNFRSYIGQILLCTIEKDFQKTRDDILIEEKKLQEKLNSEIDEIESTLRREYLIEKRATPFKWIKKIFSGNGVRPAQLTLNKRDHSLFSHKYGLN